MKLVTVSASTCSALAKRRGRPYRRRDAAELVPGGMGGAVLARHSELRCTLTVVQKCGPRNAANRCEVPIWARSAARSSLFPTMVGYLSQVQSLGISIAICSATAFGLMLVTLLLLPETHGRSLATLETAAAGERSFSHAYSRN